jgi:hypothetical protein
VDVAQRRGPMLCVFAPCYAFSPLDLPVPLRFIRRLPAL